MYERSQSTTLLYLFFLENEELFVRHIKINSYKYTDKYKHEDNSNWIL